MRDLIIHHLSSEGGHPTRVCVSVRPPYSDPTVTPPADFVFSYDDS
jgi:hypothetical protein